MFNFLRRKSSNIHVSPQQRYVSVSHYHKPDYFLALIIFALIIFGLIMISSASVVISNEIFGNNYHYLVEQIKALVVGLVAFIVIQAIPYQFWRKFALFALIITILLLLVPAFPEIFQGIAFSYGGAYRWVHIGPLFLQPSEIAKLTLIIYFAAWLEKKGMNIKDFAQGFVPFAILIGIISILITKQPDLGTLLVTGAAAISIFFAAGASIPQMAVGSVGALGLLWLLIQTASYRLQRLMVFLNPGLDPKGAGYHVSQALLAVGSGGWWGLGFGHSRQKYNYLPEVATDSIYAVIVEELGFLRAMLIPILFTLFAWRGLRVAKYAPDRFGRLLAVGITAWLCFQALINISAMIGLLPLTGIPLPFISYGGSSLVVALCGIGILLNISKQTVKT
jgi:cell division protein FtsW